MTVLFLKQVLVQVDLRLLITRHLLLRLVVIFDRQGYAFLKCHVTLTALLGCLALCSSCIRGSSRYILLLVALIFLDKLGIQDIPVTFELLYLIYFI